MTLFFHYLRKDISIDEAFTLFIHNNSITIQLL